MITLVGFVLGLLGLTVLAAAIIVLLHKL